MMQKYQFPKCVIMLDIRSYMSIHLNSARKFITQCSYVGKLSMNSEIQLHVTAFLLVSRYTYFSNSVATYLSPLYDRYI